MVAQSCISETESMATLVTLLDAASDGHLKNVLQELARDEVQHARLGWSTCPGPRTGSTCPSSPAFLPAMAAAATGDDLFQARPARGRRPGSFSAVASYRWATVAGFYLETLDSVAIPGSSRSSGSTPGSLRQWADDKRRAVAGLESDRRVPRPRAVISSFSSGVRGRGHRGDRDWSRRGRSLRRAARADP